MGPLPHSDGHDLPGLFDKVAPGMAKEVDNLAIGCEDAVGQAIVAEEQPDVPVRIAAAEFVEDGDSP